MRRVLLVAAVALAAAPAPAAAQQALTIYSSLPLTGFAREQSQSVVRAANLALKQAGRRVGPYEIRLRSLDDASAAFGKWDPEVVDRNARAAADDPTAIAYLGEFNSGASAISMPILNEAGLLQVSPSNTYVGLTRAEGADIGEPDKYRPTGRRTYARVVPADHRQADALVEYLRVTRVRRVFIAHDGEVYGKGLGEMVRRRAARAGLRIVAFRRARSARAIAAAVRRSSANGFLYTGITQNGAVRLFNAVNRARPRLKLFGPDGVAEEPFSRRLRRAARGRTYVTNPTLPPQEHPAAGRQFFRDYRARYGEPAQPYAIYGYTAIQLILNAIAKGGADRAAVVDAFFATRDVTTALGTFSIDANGDTTLREYGGLRVDGSGDLTFERVLRSRG